MSIHYYRQCAEGTAFPFRYRKTRQRSLSHNIIASSNTGLGGIFTGVSISRRKFASNLETYLTVSI